MKKKYLLFSFLLLGLMLVSACQKNKSNSNDNTNNESGTVLNEVYSDSLVLEQGTIPNGWLKTELGKGFFVAFPQTALKRNLKSKKRTEYRVEKKKYTFYASISSLSDEPVFFETKEDKSLFFEVVLHDLIVDMTEEGKEKPQIFAKEDFLCLNLYEGMYAHVKSDDIQLYIECFTIGNKLYTLAFLLWDKETAAIMQLKDQFFYSFGKELSVK